MSLTLVEAWTAARDRLKAAGIDGPVIDDKIVIEIEDKYLRIDTYRSSGAGGQHVNKTDSAVRLTYTAPGP